MARREVAVNEDMQEGNQDGVLTMANGQKILAPDGNVKPGPGKSIPWHVPQKDVDGTVPEFVNITGKKQILRPPESPGTKIEIKPWGILRGAQFRHTYVDDYPGRKRSPKFIERERGKNGEYDSKYLLTVDQVVKQIRRWRGGKLRIDLQWAIKNIMGIRDNGARVDGAPEHLDQRERDDRPEVINAVMEQRQYVEMRLDLLNLANGTDIDEDKQKFLLEQLKITRERLYPDEK